MSKAKPNSFKKGQVANPKGRPTGSYSPLRKQLMELRNMAADKSKEAFEALWKDFEAGDPLAKQIYFKELVSVPKDWLNEVSTINVPTEIKSVNDIDRAIAALASALLSVDSISTDEALNLIKAYEARMQDIKLFIEWKRERNQTKEP